MNEKLFLAAAFVGTIASITLKDAIAIASGLVSIIAGICATIYYIRKIKRDGDL